MKEQEQEQKQKKKKRGGQPGNRGNRNAKGRPRVADPKKTRAYTATDSEHELIKEYSRILTQDPARAARIRLALGTCPTGRAAKDETRRQRTIRAREAEWPTLKEVIKIIHDRERAAAYIIHTTN